MREVIAICRSRKKSRDRVARVLDRYFWRIGDRTWRGKASNACLDRASRELRRKATRNTAVTIHEIRSAHESRIPLIRIGTRKAFSVEGLAPVASHPAMFSRGGGISSAEKSAAAVVRIAALFHDLGKATNMFQAKLRRALDGGKAEGDTIRHELYSAVVWDQLFGKSCDESLSAELESLSSEKVDEACKRARQELPKLLNKTKPDLNLNFCAREGSLSHIIGMMILTHHRLPAGDSDHLKLGACKHVKPEGNFKPEILSIADGIPFWHEPWWNKAIRREAKRLDSSAHIASPDIGLRASLMFADHVGSAQKTISEDIPNFLANTTKHPTGAGKPVSADDLSTHIRRVYDNAKGAFDLLYRYRERFPALDEGQIPVDVMYPHPCSAPQFRWQAEAAKAARDICESAEGGFFACVMAGTGTGKTRGAPTILANAAIGDVRPERRYLRMSLALGLRVLATQSASDYVDDLGFRNEDVSVLIGGYQLDFTGSDSGENEDVSGSESLIELPEWLQVEFVKGGVPDEGTDGEAAWLRTLSIDTDRGLPAFCDRIIEHAGKRTETARRLLTPPVMVGTVDHLMGVASPVNSSYLIQSIRLMTADLILDEIDQFDDEDIAAIGRLIFQAGAAGRRVIIMSATLTMDVAEALHTAYARGWSEHAGMYGVRDHVNLLCVGDAPDSCFTNGDGRSLSEVMADCRRAILNGIHGAHPARRGEILVPCEAWPDLVKQIDKGCTRMHTRNAVEVCGFRVSVGMIRMTRISHTAALAAQLQSGWYRDGHLRILLCLHAQFPRLHRAWIETRLKRALTRKGKDPDAGLKSLCQSENVFKRAADMGAHEIELVVVASPVIETGNDLDFDYAILDPISTRSVIQAAGRVRRHRPAEGDHVNVLILGRSPIAMQEGRLENPGAETPPSKDTGVPRVDLDKFVGRKFADLAGDQNFAAINAAPFLCNGGHMPLRDKEIELRQKMVRADEDKADAPLGRYIRRLNARLNRQMTQTRKFRRSETGNILYQMIGKDNGDADWYLDIQPGTKYSKLYLASERGLAEERISGEHLFESLPGLITQDFRDMTGDDLKRMRVEIPQYGDVDDPCPAMTYTEFTGFTRGVKKDLFAPFGKQK